MWPGAARGVNAFISTFVPAVLSVVVRPVASPSVAFAVELFAADELRVVLVRRVPAVVEREQGALIVGRSAQRVLLSPLGGPTGIERSDIVLADVVPAPLRAVEELERLGGRLPNVLVGRAMADLLQLQVVLRVDEDDVGRAAVPRRPFHHERRVGVHLDVRVRELGAHAARAHRAGARSGAAPARHPQPVVRRSVGCEEPEGGRRAAAPPATARARHAGDEGDADGERAQPADQGVGTAGVGRGRLGAPGGLGPLVGAAARVAAGAVARPAGPQRPPRGRTLRRRVARRVAGRVGGAVEPAAGSE